MKMIRPLLASLFFLATFVVAKAQMTDGGVRFGVKLGVSGANLYDDAKASDKKSRIGITGGAFAQIPFAKNRMAIRPELLFVTKGGAYDYANGGRPDLKLNYVELPVSIEYRLLGFVNLHAGMYASLLASADGEIEQLPSVEVDREFFETLDYGWQLGGGIDFGGLGLHFRVSRGLQKINSGSAIEFDTNLKNAAWALTLSYGI